MKPLDQDSRRLIDEASAADVPAPDLEAKLWQTLAPRLAAPLPPTAARAQRALGSGTKLSALSGVSAKLLIGLGVLGTFAGTYAVHELRHEPQPTLAPSSVAAVPREPAAIAAPDSAATAAPAPANASNLSDETQLLANAQRALSGGAAARALLLLDQHRARFRDGELAQERDAARVLALCALGRAAEAQRERQRFLRSFRDSPLTARVRAACPPARGPR